MFYLFRELHNERAHLEIRRKQNLNEQKLQKLLTIVFKQNRLLSLFINDFNVSDTKGVSQIFPSSFFEFRVLTHSWSRFRFFPPLTFLSRLACLPTQRSLRFPPVPDNARDLSTPCLPPLFRDACSAFYQALTFCDGKTFFDGLLWLLDKYAAEGMSNSINDRVWREGSMILQKPSKKDLQNTQTF